MHFRHQKGLKRFELLEGRLSLEDIALLKSTSFDDLALADTLIENAMGYLTIPLAFAPGIVINDKEYPLIPLVIEETSVVAGLSKTIEWIGSNSTIYASHKGETLIGQIHIPQLENPNTFEEKILAIKDDLKNQANLNPCATMVKRGGGVRDITFRRLLRPDAKQMGVIHVLMDTKDAMGANIINQTCEYLKPLIEEATHEKVLICILSNLNTQKLTRIELTIKDIDEEIAHKIAEASMIAQVDPYRAVTHNKGIMNGMDAICLATGNDWRALEAGMHGYAVQEGQYRGLSKWSAENRQLKGILEGPINVGIVGGVTSIHPTASLSLRCLGITNAIELGYVIGAIGLIQNLAALRALVTDGISKGHMRFHLTNLIKQTDATPLESVKITKLLKKTLIEQKYVTATDVQRALELLRS